MKKVYSLATIIGLGLCFGAVNTNSANASEFIPSNSETIIAGDMSKSEMKMKNYLLGTVGGQSGQMMSITVEDGGSFETNEEITPGTKVLVGVDSNGEYHLVSSDRSNWTSVLEKDGSAERSEMLMGEMSTSTDGESNLDPTVYDPAGDNTEDSTNVTTGNNTTSTSSMPDRDVDSTRIEKHSDDTTNSTNSTTSTNNTSSFSDNDVDSTRIEKHSDGTTNRTTSTSGNSSLSDNDVDSTRIEKHSDDKTSTQMNTDTQMNNSSSMDMDDDDSTMMEDQNQPVRGLW